MRRRFASSSSGWDISRRERTRTGSWARHVGGARELAGLRIPRSATAESRAPPAAHARIVRRVSSNHGAVQQLSARGEMMKTRASRSVRWNGRTDGEGSAHSQLRPGAPMMTDFPPAPPMPRADIPHDLVRNGGHHAPVVDCARQRHNVEHRQKTCAASAAARRQAAKNGRATRRRRQCRARPTSRRLPGRRAAASSSQPPQLAARRSPTRSVQSTTASGRSSVSAPVAALDTRRMTSHSATISVSTSITTIADAFISPATTWRR